ncbi:sodium-independent anion transporter [Spirochaetia bacterium]|nr:sodium-independent anion transporter [Spirochaetia bacterium]
MTFFKMVSLRDFIPRSFDLFRKGQYNFGFFKKDLLAGITVGVVALPLAMAFSIGAGGSPAQGLYTAILAGFTISLLGGSKCQIGGPTGAFVVIISGVIARLGMDGLIAATLLAGLMLIIMGLTGIGRFIKFIPYPVTTGFTTGIALIIFSQQIKDFFGLTVTGSSPEFIVMWTNYARHASTVQWITLLAGLGTMGIIIAVRTFIPRFPAAVAGVVLATLVCYFLDLPVETIGKRFGAIPQTLPLPRLPVFSVELINNVFRDSFAIAILAGIESLLSAVVADGMTGDRHNSNMELVGQGAGNIVSALFGGIPATGAIARTATNIKSGAVSPVAGLIHAITLLLFILFLAPLASAVPLASLSAVLIVVSYDMSNLQRFWRIIRRSPKSDTTVLLVTFVLTVMVDLTFAVEIGMMLAALLFIKRMIEVVEVRSSQSELAKKIMKWPEANLRKDPKTDSGKSALDRQDIEIYEITGPFFFGVADTLQHTLRAVNKKPFAFILQMKEVPVIDTTGIIALESFLAQCRSDKTQLVLCEVHDQPLRALQDSGFIDELGREHVWDTLEEALMIFT